MFRRNHLVFLSAGLAAALAACHPSTPTTSVSALSYQVQSAGAHSASVAADPARASSAQPPSREPVAISPNDPMRLFDMP